MMIVSPRQAAVLGANGAAYRMRGVDVAAARRAVKQAPLSNPVVAQRVSTLLGLKPSTQSGTGQGSKP